MSPDTMTLLPMGTAPLRKLRIERLRWGAAVLLAMALTYLVVLSTRHAQVYVLESMSVGAENKVSLTANDTKLQARLCPSAANGIYVQRDPCSLQERRAQLQERLDEIDWKLFEEHATKPLPNDLLKQYVDVVYPYIEASPPAPLRVTERPSPLQIPPDCRASAHQASPWAKVLTGKPRDESARVFDLFLFASEFDILEMRLYELHEVVDYFVIIESVRSLRGHTKPLGYARNKERYARFAHQIIHLVLDDADLLPLARKGTAKPGENFWDIEFLQQRALVQGALAAVGFRDTDVVIASDSDEVPLAEYVSLLRYCEVLPDAFPLALSSSHSYRFSFNWVVSNYTVTYPKVFTGRLATELLEQGSRFRNETPQVAISGTSVHMTTFGDIVTDLLKGLQFAEGRVIIPAGDVRYLSRPFDMESQCTDQGIRIGQSLDNPENDRTTTLWWLGPVMHRTEFIDKYGDQDLPRIPWVAAANPERYPLLMPNDKPFRRMH